MRYNNLHEYQKADKEKRQNRLSRRGPILTVDRILSLDGNYVLNWSPDGQAALNQVKLWKQQEAEAKRAADSGGQSPVAALAAPTATVQPRPAGSVSVADPAPILPQAPAQPDSVIIGGITAPRFRLPEEEQSGSKMSQWVTARSAEDADIDADAHNLQPAQSQPATSGAAVFAPVVDPSYADFLKKLTDAINAINSNSSANPKPWLPTKDSNGADIANSWTNNTHHIKVFAIQDSTSGQTSLVVEPTEATKLKSQNDFQLYFINMFDVMAHTRNKYSLVSPGVENLLKGLAADSGAHIDLVRDGLKAAIEDPNFKAKFEGCLHESTRKAFEAQAALAPSAAASGSHGAGAGTTASAAGAGTTPSAGAGVSAGAATTASSARMAGPPPNAAGTPLAGAQGGHPVSEENLTMQGDQ